MLVMTGILLVAACLLVGTYAVMAGRCKEQLAAVEHDVRAEVDVKTKAALELDTLLSKRLADGKPTAMAIDQWQQARTEILQTGRTNRPWAWTSEELKVWARERMRALGDEIRRRFCVGFILATVTLVLVTGTAAGVYYHIYAATQLPFGGSTANSVVPPLEAFGSLIPPPAEIAPPTSAPPDASTPSTGN